MKIEIFSPLVTERLGNQLWVVRERFVFSTDQTIHRIPIGFVFDGNSTPRSLWSLCSPIGGAYGEAGVIHDWLYSLDSKNKISRQEADNIHQTIGLFRGAAWFVSKIVRMGLRMGGKTSYKVIHSIDKINKKTCYHSKYALDHVIKLRQEDKSN